jgi:hypothetical protein
LGHYALFQAPNTFRDTVQAFLEGSTPTVTGG